MPTEYKRKGSTQRAQWTEEQLVMAATAIQNGTMGLREACRNYNIPPPTMRRRLKKNDLEKKSLGPTSVLGTENEKKIKLHIEKLQKYGFAPTRDCVRSMAFKLAEQLKIKNTFNKENKMAGYDWLKMFLKRNPELSVRKAEGVSLSRVQGMNKKVVTKYFDLLKTTLNEAGILNKPSHIFNMDETGLQLNNNPGQVIAKRGSKNVTAVTSSEKGETVTLIGCCNAEGFFIPPACIFKGKNKKAEFEDDMPPGSVVYMNEKSAYINTDLMFTWLRNHFIPRKPEGKVIIILDGHASHCNSVEMLEYAEQHDVILFCLPSHTTQFLQPLDRAFFKSLKAHFNNACNAYVRENPTRKITRLQLGKLLSVSWSKSATVDNAVSAFRATGICPLSIDAIPDYAYLGLEENIMELPDPQRDENVVDNVEPSTRPSSKSPHQTLIDSQPTKDNELSEAVPETTIQEGDTPGTLLNKLNPVPSTSSGVEKARKRSRQVAAILTSPEHIDKRKSVEAVKQQKLNKKEKKELAKQNNVTKTKKPIIKSARNRIKSSSEEDTSDFVPQESEDSISDEDDTECRGCGENYNQTQKKDDWIQCVHCERWFHESCSKYLNLCDLCGKALCQKRT